VKKLDYLNKFEEEVRVNIDDSVGNYLNDDWEDEFEDIFEAYSEQGRGQAESQAVINLIKREFPNIPDDELVKLMDQLADLWNISYD
jgi:hypothetical protein